MQYKKELVLQKHLSKQLATWNQKMELEKLQEK